MARKKQNKLLTNLELEVMRAVWGAKECSQTARQVTEELNQTRDQNLAYNTVQTVLSILKDKGFLKTKLGAGRAHIYSATKSRDEVSKSMVGDLVNRLYDGAVQPLLHKLVEEDSMSRSELEDLKLWISQKLDDEGASS